MVRIISAIALLMITASAWAFGDQPLTDPELKKVDEEMNQKIAECQKKFKKEEVIRRLECGKRINYEYQKKGVVRGTKEYFETRYKKLSTSELSKLRESLGRQREKARTFSETQSDPEGKRIGEVTKDDLDSEIQQIEFELQDRKAHRKQ